MRVSPRHLLPALLLCSPTLVQAQVGESGDFWIVHQQGESKNHEVFVADGDPLHVVRRANGVAAVDVLRVYEGDFKPVMTIYSTEMDCAANRVRILKASDLEWNMTTLTPVKVSAAWQTAPETWLAQGRDFFCKPDERTSKGMKPLGHMGAIAMVDQVRRSFMVVQREESWAPVMKMIDDAFERMPQN